MQRSTLDFNTLNFFLFFHMYLCDNPCSLEPNLWELGSRDEYFGAMIHKVIRNDGPIMRWNKSAGTPGDGRDL